MPHEAHSIPSFWRLPIPPKKRNPPQKGTQTFRLYIYIYICIYTQQMYRILLFCTFKDNTFTTISFFSPCEHRYHETNRTWIESVFNSTVRPFPLCNTVSSSILSGTGAMVPMTDPTGQPKLVACRSSVLNLASLSFLQSFP